MENLFPCKDCLVKMVCKDECEKLTKYSRIINMYVSLYNTCPDCGNNLNENGYKSNDYILCFQCNSAFRKMPIVKSNVDPLDIIPIITRAPKFNLKSPSRIITNTSMPKSNKPKPQQLSSSKSMEKTHDIVYERMSKREALYIIEKHSLNVRHNIIKKFPDPFKKKSKKKKASIPNWTKAVNIPSIGIEDQPCEDGPGIILK